MHNKSFSLDSLKKYTYSADVKKIKYWNLADMLFDFYKTGGLFFIAAIILYRVHYISLAPVIATLLIHTFILICAIAASIKADSYKITIADETILIENTEN